MDWIADHQILLAGLALIALVVVGVVVLVARAVTLSRTARTAMRMVEEPVGEISAGLAEAERRVGVIAEGQADLMEAVERVEAKTGELRVLIDHAGRAYAVLRGPLRYFGK